MVSAPVSYTVGMHLWTTCPACQTKRAVIYVFLARTYYAENRLVLSPEACTCCGHLPEGIDEPASVALRCHWTFGVGPVLPAAPAPEPAPTQTLERLGIFQRLMEEGQELSRKFRRETASMRALSPEDLKRRSRAHTTSPSATP